MFLKFLYPPMLQELLHLRAFIKSIFMTFLKSFFPYTNLTCDEQRSVIVLVASTLHKRKDDDAQWNFDNIVSQG